MLVYKYVSLNILQFCNCQCSSVVLVLSTLIFSDFSDFHLHGFLSIFLCSVLHILKQIHFVLVYIPISLKSSLNTTNLLFLPHTTLRSLVTF